MAKMTAATPGVVSLSIVGVAILVLSEVASLRARAHRMIAWCLSRIRQRGTQEALAQSPSASDAAIVASGYTERDIEEAIALAIEIERARHEPYPREWE
jgi:hypothetical protein